MVFTRSSLLIGILVAIIVLGGGFFYWSGLRGGEQASRQLVGVSQTPQAPTPQAVTPLSQGDGTSVGQNLILGLNSDTTLGSFLSAYNGMTVYTFSHDRGGTSNCAGDCALLWPPYIVPAVSDIHVPAYIKGEVGTSIRTNGALQVTYRGAPLYFYVKDTKPGDTKGENIDQSWFVARP